MKTWSPRGEKQPLQVWLQGASLRSAATKKDDATFFQVAVFVFFKGRVGDDSGFICVVWTHYALWIVISSLKNSHFFGT